MLRITLISLFAFFFTACTPESPVAEDPLLEEAIAQREAFSAAFPFQSDKVYVVSKKIKTASGLELVVQTETLNATHWLRTDEGIDLPNPEKIFALLDMEEMGTYRGEEVVEHSARILVMSRDEWKEGNGIENFWPPCVNHIPEFCHLFYAARLTSLPFCPCLMLCSTNGIFLNSCILIPCRPGFAG